jgi:hypothetical protein
MFAGARIPSRGVSRVLLGLGIYTFFFLAGRVKIELLLGVGSIAA